ncbi:MAG: hypothetical protein GW880_30215 [Armatimonadetes bacterium]|nr:hypothetical protein [Armatimonadota bacterium]
MAVETGWCQEKEECVRNNMGLVYGVISGKLGHRRKKKYAEWGANVGLDRPALEEYGKWGLEEAWSGFDPERGTQFSTYAVRIIEQKLTDSMVGEMPDRLPRETAKQRKWVLEVEERLTQELGRLPTDEEVALKAEVVVEKVSAFRNPWRSVPLDEPVGDREEAGNTVGDQVPGDDLSPEGALLAEKDEQEATRRLTRFKTLFDTAGLTDEERLVLALRWGLNQSLTPRPRAEVARVLAEDYHRTEYVITGPKRAKSGGTPKYLTDRVRMAELRASRKVSHRVLAERGGTP